MDVFVLFCFNTRNLGLVPFFSISLNKTACNCILSFVKKRQQLKKSLFCKIYLSMHFITIVLIRSIGRKEIKSWESDKDLTQTYSKSVNISAAKELIMNKIMRLIRDFKIK